MLLCADSIMGESVCVQTRAGARMAPLPAAAGSGQAMPVTQFHFSNCDLPPKVYDTYYPAKCCNTDTARLTCSCLIRRAILRHSCAGYGSAIFVQHTLPGPVPAKIW